jgi:hypothetical protein
MTQPVDAGTQSEDEQIAAAVESAKIPTLLVVLVQLTGERHWLEAPYRPGRARGWATTTTGAYPHRCRPRSATPPLELQACDLGADRSMCCTTSSSPTTTPFPASWRRASCWTGGADMFRKAPSHAQTNSAQASTTSVAHWIRPRLLISAGSVTKTGD